jgi:hypothetical protein
MDLDKLALWRSTWGMQYHPQKCNSLSITRSDPCGTPLTTGFWLETSPSRTTRCCLLLRKAEIQFQMFPDFSKAFDKVPHKKLLRKLDNYGIRGNIWNWISAFLNNRQQQVVLDYFFIWPKRVLDEIDAGKSLMNTRKSSSSRTDP